MEMTRRDAGFLPSFFRGIDDDFFGSTKAMIQSKIAVNIMDRENDYLVEMVAPGFKKEDLHVEIDGNKLTIRGEISEKKEVNEESYTHREFSYGEFVRSFTLPKDVNIQNIDADFKNGILQIIVPKPVAKQKVVKKIEVKGD